MSQITLEHKLYAMLEVADLTMKTVNDFLNECELFRSDEIIKATLLTTINCLHLCKREMLEEMENGDD